MNAINNVYRLCKRGIRGARCNRPLGEHCEGKCPQASESRHTFQASKSCNRSVSNSFGIDEVELLHEITTRLMRGADVKHVTRAPAFASVARKVQSMSERVKAQKAGR